VARKAAPRRPPPSPAETGGRERILLLDGHSLAYRAFYALPTTLATSTGQVTNAVYGFTSMLIKLLAEQRTDRVAVAFDVGPPTARLSEYAEYKAGRAETPDEFRSQLGLLREVLRSLRIPIFEVAQHEADDVLATLARRAAAQGMEAVIVTADRDFLQLVSPGISVLFNRRGVTDIVRYDEAAVQERFGLPPSKLVDYVALRGDPSDNLPGVPGVGEKTASRLIQQFGSVEELYRRIGEVPPKLRPALEAAREQVLQNHRLATLVDTLALEAGPADVRMGEWDLEEIHRLFSSLEFRSLYERLGDVRRAPEAGPVSFVARAAGGSDVAGRARAAGRAAVVAAPGGEGIAIALSDDEAVWVPDDDTAHRILEDPSIAKVTHGAKQLAVRMMRAGGFIAGLDLDVEIAAYLLDPASGAYDLASISRRYLGRELPVPSESGDDGQMSLEVAGAGEVEAACAGAAALIPLGDRLSSDLERLGMLELWREVERPLIDVLARMERTGVAIDTSLLASMSRTLGTEIDGIERRIFELAGGAFNLNSPPQLREVLFNRLKLTPSRRTKTGFSTDATTLESLRGLHPIVEEILRYRELSKLRSTYLDALPPLVDPADGRLHATFNQTAAATGRISSENPNVQNIPVRTELGREIRRAFVAGFPDHVLLVADYSQIELRVIAHFSGDEGLRGAFARGEDVHAATAAAVWGFDLAQVPKDLRNRAKMINYGLSYGMSAYGLAQRLGITPDEASEFIEAYFKGFPRVKEFMEQIVREAYRDGYTVTVLGRRRYLPELEHRNPRVRSLGERQALNAPIQGSQADIIKLAMLKVDRGLAERDLKARMVLTVHDELIFEVPRDELAATTDAVRSLMEQAYPLDVPLKVDLSTGSSWADAKG
jgi:DNA polymerase-1